ncbi:MAG: hypothetical protein JAY75_19795 [Candidatus Thiodiazotropha taylori]|nr:hypothetical protein [Candidatus Thiodiazotropha taylori]MCG8096936.1 hypothetical protein [Candidatus Thiodiazotropha endolucinida]MCG7882615.1 hypothetical protein [Candidatus Thiodiazotropha taylori]MCG8032151.1 hypothetical protein [Candidatus Thiodiazotropha taylori]MCG8044296.1 hypothetical protein [Candidatus Thiodiazotropha taylori]
MAATKEDITEEELKLIGAMRHLRVKPEGIESAQDFEKYVRSYDHDLVTDKRTIPRVSIFFGEEGKGEVGFQTWKYEIQCLLHEGKYPEDQLLMAIRRSAKGEAANILRRLGTSATIVDILKKFESTFGDIDSPEIVLKKFYAVEQKSSESLVAYATRIEELFAQACAVGALRPTQEEILKSVFYQGLKPPLKQFGNLKYETVKDYDKFKVEMRKIENELNSSQAKESKEKETATKCNAINANQSSELKEMKELLKEMNDRIKTLEDQKQNVQNYGNVRPRGMYRGPRHYRGGFNRGQAPRGRAQYTPIRPVGTNTFTPKTPGNQNKFRCYSCHQEGHIARNCPENL